MFPSYMVHCPGGNTWLAWSKSHYFTDNKCKAYRFLSQEAAYDCVLTHYYMALRDLVIIEQCDMGYERIVMSSADLAKAYGGDLKTVEDHYNEEGLNLRVKLCGGLAPTQREDSAGFDCYARGNIKIPSMRYVRFGLGFAAAFNTKYVALLLDKSSIGNKGGMHLAGVIEGTYRDEWNCTLYNCSLDTIIIPDGKSAIQAVFVEYGKGAVTILDAETFDALPKTTRGKHGFGSTEVAAFLKTVNLALDPNASTEDVIAIDAWIKGGMVGTRPSGVLEQGSKDA